WTIEEIANWIGVGGNGPVLVGSAQTVADELQQWVEDTDVDGFNLAYILAHQSFQDVVDFIVPELQKRGVYPKQYSEGTLREKLFQNNAHLPDWHRGAAYRKTTLSPFRAAV
ncbi:MAG: 5,10-methylene tetrahydromethanopterin reductase, partial [Pseudomonadota bacterium]|nr:5,10-methylene tetrahydromethanopterin reductase [Pseudomonadota bacterium]